MTGIVTASMMRAISSRSLMRATPPAARMSAGMRSSAMTATAPASCAIAACSGVTTSMMTPPLSICARPRLTVTVPVWFCISMIRSSSCSRCPYQADNGTTRNYGGDRRLTEAATSGAPGEGSAARSRLAGAWGERDRQRRRGVAMLAGVGVGVPTARGRGRRRRGGGGVGGGVGVGGGGDARVGEGRVGGDRDDLRAASNSAGRWRRWCSRRAPG